MNQSVILVALTDDDQYALTLAQCQVTLTQEALRIQVDDWLWDLVVDQLDLLCPCRLEVTRVELWRDGQLWQSVGIGFWIGYPVA